MALSPVRPLVVTAESLSATVFWISGFYIGTVKSIVQVGEARTCGIMRKYEGSLLSICRKTSRSVRLSLFEAREANDVYVILCIVFG